MLQVIRKGSLVLMAAAFLLWGAMAFAAGGQDDSVLSQHVKEADGTSGQDTNSGSGIKTGHIQDGAVTTGKVADGAVTDAKITGPISASKLGSHTHSGTDITDGTVSTQKLQDGAVTDAKITGPISASKISSAGLNADTVDGQHASEFAPAVHTHTQSDVSGLVDALNGKADVDHNHDDIYQRKYANVAVVALSGGDYTDPVSAMNDINSWCWNPSSGNPCLLKIMPGVYDVGANSLSMRPYVDIEGSGENTTVITGNIGGGGLVRGAGAAEPRFLTVENVVSAQYSGETVAIFNNGASPKITHVTANAINTAGDNCWWCAVSGISNWNASPTMSHVTATATASGQRVYTIVNSGTSTTIMTDVTATATGGDHNFAVLNNGGHAGTVIMKDVVLNSAEPMWNYQMAVVKCIDVFDGNYDPITCP